MDADISAEEEAVDAAEDALSTVADDRSDIRIEERFKHVLQKHNGETDSDVRVVAVLGI